MKTIAVIPARSGSKGLKDKNIRVLGEKTLLEHAVRVGLDSSSVDHVFISTDSSQYESLAVNSGACSLGLRSAVLANDQASSVDVIIDFLDQLGDHEVENIVLLQPTSPVRNPSQINECVRCSQSSGESVVAVARLEEPHPYKLKIIKNGTLESFISGACSEIPRQILPEVYQLTGSIYVTPVSVLRERNSFFSEHTQPFLVDHFVNIDSIRDLYLAEFLLERGEIDIYGL